MPVLWISTVRLQSVQIEWWDEIIAIDQSSLFYMMKDTIPHMMASGKGSIINVSSIGGVFGNGGISYSAAKSAALAMT